jgi:hypothetical protein
MTNRSKFYLEGYAAGKARGSWVIDGNTTLETCQRIVQGFDDGDPEIMDIQPSPLSGEWAGESIKELFGYQPSSHCLDLYEQGYSEGFWDEVMSAARSQVEWDVMQREQESNYLAGLGV